VDWNDLSYFLAVARTGSMTAAARELGVEHTTVGRRLGALESALGAKLFARGPGGLTLTAAGREIVPCVEEIAHQIDAIARRVTGVDSKVAGLVRVTIPESGNTYFMPQFSELRGRYPELTLEVLSDNRIFDLRRGEADVAVRFSDSMDPDLIVRKAGTAGWTLFASQAYLDRKGSLVSPSELGDHDIIGYDPTLSRIDGGLWIQRHVPAERIVMRGNSIAAVVSAAAAGVGIAALPCFAAAHEPSLIRLHDALICSRTILVVVHPDLIKVARVRATVDFLNAMFARDAPLWSGVPSP